MCSSRSFSYRPEARRSVQDLDRIGVAHAAIGELNERRIPVLDDVDFEHRAHQPGCEHDGADQADEAGIKKRTRTQELNQLVPSLRPCFLGGDRVIGMRSRTTPFRLPTS